MATDLIRYDLLVQSALRGVVKRLLLDAQRDGLPGEHHFYISFKTGAPGVRLSNRLRERYPEEMTIVLQHQFWDLGVTEHAFEVGLSFSNIPERLLVPFDAVSGFFDPSVQFGLKFEADEEATPALPVAIAPSPQAADETGRKATRGAGSEPAILVPAADAPKALPSAVKATAPERESETAENSGEEPAKIVSLDAFRKKT